MLGYNVTSEIYKVIITDRVDFAPLTRVPSLDPPNRDRHVYP